MNESSYSKSKILLVLDLAKELVLIRSIVLRHGDRLWEADTVERGFELANQHLPDLVLLDISTPSVGQDELPPFINYLKQHQVPLILITSAAPHEELKKCLNITALDYVQRSIDPVVLMLRIRAAIHFRKVQIALKLVRQKLEESRHKLQQTTIFDEATGVFNSAHLLSLIKLEFARCVRYNSPLAILLADIPGLNEVKNDYGTDTRDHLLKELVLLIRSSLRSSDTIGRCEENRLGILLSETGSAGAEKVVKKICSLVSEHGFELSALTESSMAKQLAYSANLPLKLDVRLGFSTYPDEKIANHEELLAAANQALLKAS